jgi:macrolide transport system ATP-binding/permease protein
MNQLIAVMQMITRIWRAFSDLIRSKREERELDEELQFHLQNQIEQNVERGMNPEEARYAARRLFGGVEQVKERCRDLRGVNFVESVIQDIQFGLRQLRRNPGFTVVAVMTLAFGLGVNASVFSFLDAVLLRPLAVPGSSRVEVLHRGEATSFSYPNYVAYREGNHAFSALAAAMPTEATIDLEGRSEIITAEAVSANYQDVMRVPLTLGRWFSQEDQPLAVISYRVWKRRFHGDPKVIGKQVRSISAWFTVVGVAPPGFTGVSVPMDTDLWVPFRYWMKQFPALSKRMNNAASPTVMIFGRLRHGLTPAEASVDLNSVDARVRTLASTAGSRMAPIALTPVAGALNLGIRDELMPVMTVLAVVAGLVLLIACVNVGNLVLDRGAARRRELAARVALGASRRRVARQLLTESLLLAALGGLGGVLLGAWTNWLIESLIPALPIHLSIQLRVDDRVIAFTAAVTLVAALLVGMLPAWHSTRMDVFPVLKGEAAPPGQFRLRQAALVGQVAVSLVLLLSAGLLLYSILRLRATSPGFAVKNRLYAWTFISRPEFMPETGREFYTRTLQSLRALPGIRSAGLTHFLPLLVDTGSECVSDGHATPLQASHGTIGPGYLNTMAIPLLEGRDFTPSDTPRGPAVVIVNETLADRLWPHEGAVGRRVLIGCQKARAAAVVGVVRDSKTRSLTEAPHPYFYRAFSQNYTGLATIVIHTAGDPRAAVPMVRRTLLGEAKGVRIYALDTLAHEVEQSYWETRWIASLLVVFGLLALGLAAVGLYGVIAYRVTLRIHEIGVRMAFGARPRDIRWLVLRQGLAITLVGVAVGLAGSLAFTRLLSSFLGGISPLDPLILAGTAALWFIAAALACYLPARHAMKVDPAVALRHE